MPKGADVSEFVSWEDLKAEARRLDPSWDDTELVGQRQQAREQILATVAGARLAEFRKQSGMTQTQLAKATGLSRTRISLTERGEAVSLAVLRSYVAGLGGEVKVVAQIGDVWLTVA